MGKYTAIIDSQTSNGLQHMVYFENRIYACSNTVVYKSNLSLNAWELEIPITLPSGSGYNPKMVVYDGNLYIASLYWDLWVLNVTRDDFDFVCSGDTNYGTENFVIHDNSLFICLGLSQGGIARFNGSSWDTVTTYSGGNITSAVSTAGSLYVLSIDGSVILWDGIFHTETLPGYGYNGSKFLTMYNDDFYSIIGTNLCKLSGLTNGSSWDVVCSIYPITDPNMYKAYDLVVYRNNFFSSMTDYFSDTRLYNVGDYIWDSLFKKGSTSYSLEGKVSLLVNGNDLYLCNENSNSIFKYSMITSMDFSSNKLYDLAPATIDFSSASVLTDYPITDFLWTFNDGEFSTDQNPIHTFIRGTYSIQLTITDGVETGSKIKYSFVDAYDGLTHNIDSIEKLQLIGSPGNILTSLQGYSLHDSYIQTADIDATITSTWNNEIGFLPIGYSVNSGEIYNVFSGIYDGSNFNITNLFIDSQPIDSYLSIYVYTGLFSVCENAIFRNINLINVNMSNVDGDVGSLVCYSTSNTTDRTLVENCYVTGILSGSFVGGFCYYAVNFDFINCSSEINITCTNQSGGFLSSGAICTFNDCYCISTINSLYNSLIGGFCGSLNEGEISTCHATVNISTQNSAGGLLGYGNNVELTDCYTEGSITAQNYSGGIAGRIYAVNSILNCYSTCSILCILEGSFNGGIFGSLNSYSTTFEVRNCYYTGNISGGQYTCGGFAGEILFQGLIINCYSTGSVECFSRCGGFAGYSLSSLYEGCYSIGDVTGWDRLSGFLGYGNSSNIKNCYSIGNVSLKDASYSFFSVTTPPNSIGGFLGYVTVITLSNCYSRGNVIVTNNAVTGNQVGGFVGYLSSNTTFRCCSIGNVNAVTSCVVGGFAGYISCQQVKECFSWGDISCSGNVCGSFAGDSYSNISNSFCKSNIVYSNSEAPNIQVVTTCTSSTDLFCRQVEVQAPYGYYTTSYSSTGMNVRWIALSAPTVLEFYDNFGENLNKSEYKIFFDFTCKNSGSNPSIIEFGEMFFSYSTYHFMLLNGFRIEVYRSDYSELPEGIVIYGINRDNASSSQVEILRQSNIFGSKFSLIYEKRGCKSFFYINGTLIWFFNGEGPQGEFTYTALRMQGVDAGGGLFTECEFSKFGIEIKPFKSNLGVSTGGFVGLQHLPYTLSKCYCVGDISSV